LSSWGSTSGHPLPNPNLRSTVTASKSGPLSRAYPVLGWGCSTLPISPIPSRREFECLVAPETLLSLLTSTPPGFSFNIYYVYGFLHAKFRSFWCALVLYPDPLFTSRRHQSDADSLLSWEAEKSISSQRVGASIRYAPSYVTSRVRY